MDAGKNPDSMRRPTIRLVNLIQQSNEILSFESMRYVSIILLWLGIVVPCGCSKSSAPPKPLPTATERLRLPAEAIGSLQPAELHSKANEVVYEVLKETGTEDPAVWDATVAQLPPQWRLVYTIMTLDGQVRNGGFHQYFFNSRCRLIKETENDLAYLGATEFHQICAEAFRGIDLAYYTSPDRDEDDWEKFTSKYSDKKWEILEDRFFQQKPRLSDLVGSFIKQHPDLYTTAQ